MPLLSEIARRKKITYFFSGIHKSHKILEIGCGGGWAGQYLISHGWSDYVGLDIKPPADIVGDILNWRKLGIKESSYDIVIAFEVAEHVDIFGACNAILKPGGKLMITTPLPYMDWALRMLELWGLNQKRTTPHSNLVYLKDVSCFRNKNIKIVGFLSQWGIFTKD